MFSFGYDRDAVFAAKVRRAGAGPAKLRIRGQACTETVCKNIDVPLTVALPVKAATSAGRSEAAGVGAGALVALGV